MIGDVEDGNCLDDEPVVARFMAHCFHNKMDAVLIKKRLSRTRNNTAMHAYGLKIVQAQRHLKVTKNLQ